MNFLALEGANFDIKPNGDGTFKAVIDLPVAGSHQPPMKVTIPRCAISFIPYSNQDEISHPYMVEINCNEVSDILALFTGCGGKRV